MGEKLNKNAVFACSTLQFFRSGCSVAVTRSVRGRETVSSNLTILTILCRCGGIGRHRSFRCSRLTAWGFKSLQRHHFMGLVMEWQTWRLVGATSWLNPETTGQRIVWSNWYCPCRFESCQSPPFMNEKRLKQEQDYVAFLEKRLNSSNYKANVSPEEYEKTKEKLKKAKLVLRMLK